MFKINKLLWLVLLSFSIVIFAGCGSQSNKEDKDAGKTEVNDELLKEQNALYEKACQDLSAINQKIIQLNDKIHSLKGKLTDAQNKAIDDFEEKRASVNTRMHGLKKVAPADWNKFKTTLENDMDTISTQIDKILTSIK